MGAAAEAASTTYMANGAPGLVQQQRLPPKSFCCPLSRELMTDPVLLVGSGRSFERSNIMFWLQRHPYCPITGVAVTASDPLQPNHDLRACIDEWRREHISTTFGSATPSACYPAVPTFTPTPAAAATSAQASAPPAPQAPGTPLHADLQAAASHARCSVSTPPHDDPATPARVATPPLPPASVSASVSEQEASPPPQPPPPPPAPLELTVLRAVLSDPAGPKTIDLQGFTFRGHLVSGQHLVISRPGLVVENGVVELPPGVCLAVQADGVVLRLLKISGTGSEQGMGLISVRARDVVVDRCVIQGGPGGPGPCHGVHVGPGCSASVKATGVFGTSGSGFCAAGYGARLTTHKGCRAEDNDFAGFAALDGAEVTVGRATVAARNHQHGFGGAGVGTRLVLSDGCNSLENEWGGVAATDGAHVVVGNMSVAESNRDHGFFASGPGSNLMLGNQCISRSNQWAGYAALEGGQVVVGDECVADVNLHHGYGSAGVNSRIITGKSCVATSNGWDGFAAVDGAELVAGPGCRALSNGSSGFHAFRRGSKLTLGSGYVSTDNAQHSVGASGGAEIVIAHTAT